MTYQAIVEIWEPDPNGLRGQCEEACNDWLLGEPAGLTDEELEDLAHSLLDRFLRPLAPNVTGAESLCLTIRPYQCPHDNQS